MYELFTGNYERVMGQVVYLKNRNGYIPCEVTDYFFKQRIYTLVPIEDMKNIPSEEHKKRRLYKARKIYVLV